jgi:hypothetical protein
MYYATEQNEVQRACHMLKLEMRCTTIAPLRRGIANAAEETYDSTTQQKIQRIFSLTLFCHPILIGPSICDTFPPTHPVRDTVSLANLPFATICQACTWRIHHPSYSKSNPTQAFSISIQRLTGVIVLNSHLGCCSSTTHRCWNSGTSWGWKRLSRNHESSNGFPTH